MIHQADKRAKTRMKAVNETRRKNKQSCFNVLNEKKQGRKFLSLIWFKTSENNNRLTKTGFLFGLKEQWFLEQQINENFNTPFFINFYTYYFAI